MIEFNQVSLQRGTKPLLHQANLRIHDGQKLALIGANGAGKSSLFALLSDGLSIDSGDLSIPAQWRIAHMQQEVAASDRSALDYAIDGDMRYRELEHAIANAKNDDDLAQAVDQMDQHRGYEVPIIAEQLLHGLGFSQSDMHQSVKQFSGGWRIRLNLAQALIKPSDLLLLDEPTNHLDLEATLWLEQWLKRYTGTLLFISHDRDFIDGVANNIVHLHQQSLSVYPGNYSAYERIRAEKLAQQQTLFEKQQSRIKDIEAFVTRFKAKASKAKQAQSRLKELQRMEVIAPAHVDSPFQFSFPCYDKMSAPLINLEDGQLGYSNGSTPTSLLDKVSCSIVPGHRIGLLGPNGAGKSTFLKALCNSTTLISGDCYYGEHCRIGYFAQHQLESLDTQATPALILQRLKPKASDQEIRNFLGGFGFSGDKALEIIEPFSGGEKARLSLAAVAWQTPNVLILDEPTNHLDIEMREALAMALQSFEGAILIVSHDRHLLKSTVDEYWLIDDGHLRVFDGDLDDYHQYCQQKERLAGNPANRGNEQAKTSNPEQGQFSTPEQPPSIDRKQQKRLEAERRQRLAPLRKRLITLEKDLEQQQGKLQQVEALLADTSLYESERKTELQQALAQQVELTQSIEELEMEWMELSETMEESE